MNIGARIKQARKQRGWSQPQLARECEWSSQSRISQYEQGKREPKFDDVKRLATALGVSVNWLITGADSRAPSGPSSTELQENTAGRLLNIVSGFTQEQDHFLRTLGQLILDQRLDDDSLELIERMVDKLAKPRSDKKNNYSIDITGTSKNLRTSYINSYILEDNYADDYLSPNEIMHTSKQDIAIRRLAQHVAKEEPDISDARQKLGEIQKLAIAIAENLPSEGVDDGCVLINGSDLLNFLEKCDAL